MAPTAGGCNGPRMPPVLRCALLCAASTLLPAPAGALAATTYMVNTTSDNAPNGSECSGVASDCSLRQAVDKAAAGDTVSVPADAASYALSSRITIDKQLSIVGGGAAGTTVSGGNANQIFDVTGGPVSISAITLTDALNNTGNDEGGAIFVEGGDLVLDQVVISDSASPGYGGAIEGDGNLTITRSRFVNNHATADNGGAIDFYGDTIQISDSEFVGNGAGDFGGALEVESDSTFALDRVTFDGNTAQNGGGFALTGAGTIYNSTFVGNTADATGGGLKVDGSATAVNDTFARNSSPSGANVSIPSISGISATIAVQNSIFAYPLGGGTSCDAALTDDGNNLDDDTSSSSCGFTTANLDVVGQDPNLAPAPADNGSAVATPGGPPQTLAFTGSSPAIGTASSSGCATVGSVDERTHPRGASCDMGAYEHSVPGSSSSSPGPTPTQPSPPPPPPTQTQPKPPVSPPLITNLRASRRCAAPTTLSSPTDSSQGLSFSYVLSQDATVTYQVMRRGGSPAWSACPKRAGGGPPDYKLVFSSSDVTTAGPHQKSLASTASRHGKGLRLKRGRHRVRLAKLAAGHHLAPGTYLLVVGANNANGHSPTAHVKFWIVGS